MNEICKDCKHDIFDCEEWHNYCATCTHGDNQRISNNFEEAEE